MFTTTYLRETWRCLTAAARLHRILFSGSETNVTQQLVTRWLWETKTPAQTRAVDVTSGLIRRTRFPKSIKPQRLSLLVVCLEINTSFLIFSLVSFWLFWSLHHIRRIGGYGPGGYMLFGIGSSETFWRNWTQIDKKLLWVSSLQFLFSVCLFFFAKVWFSASLVCFLPNRNKEEHV